MKPARLACVGSLNLDLVATVERLPLPGETIASHSYRLCHGGKGANQALAAARQGASVALIGCVGRDEGTAYRERLAALGLDVSAIEIHSKAPTGRAFITVDARGENQIVLVAGANARLGAAQVRRHAAAIRAAGALLLQFETTPAAVAAAIRVAARAGVRVVLNPSPWDPSFPWGRLPISTLVVNEGEAARLLRLPADSLPKQVPAVRRRLAGLAVDELVVTRGGESTLVFAPDRAFEVPVLPVRPTDTVGAGDAFAGTLAVRLAEGASLEQAVRAANCAGALATLAVGAQAALPTRRATDRALPRLGPTRAV